MSQARLPFRNLLTLVPEVEVLEGLRFALARHALTDPFHGWSDVEDSATIDVRVLDREAVLAAVEEAAAESRRELDAMFSAVGQALAAALDGSPADAAERLISAGADREEHGRLTAALRFFRAAHEAALPLGDRHAQILALRRMGRLMIASGEIAQAESCYRRSAELARDTGDTGQEVIARTGLGNVYLRIGDWPAAERCYQEALTVVESADGPGMEHERGQLMNNLAQVSLKLGRLEESRERIRAAGEIWSQTSSVPGKTIWHAACAQLHWEEGRREEARDQYLQALALNPPEVMRAVYAIDLANVYLEMGDALEARHWGRDAEQAALAAGSVGYLAEVYRGLGNIARGTGTEPVALYEKSLEIARKNGLRLSEAQTLVEYARLQRTTGNAEEARAFLEHAVSMLEEMGAQHDAQKARAELELTPAAGDPPLLV